MKDAYRQHDDCPAIRLHDGCAELPYRDQSYIRDVIGENVLRVELPINMLSKAFFPRWVFEFDEAIPDRLRRTAWGQ